MPMTRAEVEEAVKKALAGDLTEEEKQRGEERVRELSLEDLEDHLPEPVEPIRTEIPPTSAEEELKRYKNRVKANRSNMLKRLMKRFEIYQVFSPEEAAKKTGVVLTEMSRYLQTESAILGSRVRKTPQHPGCYTIVSAFDEAF